MIISFDLDSTLCEPISKSNNVEECYKVKPINLYVQLLKGLKKKGHRIIIFTHRQPVTRKATKHWLKKYGIPYDKLIMGKPKYDILIDDKSLPPYNYLTPKIVEQYVEHIQHWSWEHGKFKIRRRRKKW